MTKATKADPPVYQTRLGRIRACVWRNETQTENGMNIVRHNITLSRLYTDGTDRSGNTVWRDSYSFGRDDVMRLIEVLRDAFRWIHLNGQDQSNGQDAAREPEHEVPPQNAEVVPF